MPADLKYRRVLLKVSGEALMGERDYGLDPAMVERIADEIQSVHDLGVELCLVIGGGNIFRGLSGAAVGMERASADYMGMLATVINSLAMQNELERRGVSHPRPVGDLDAVGVRALYPAPRDAPSRKGPGRDLRRRHRQSVLHDRHRGGAARLGDGLRRPLEGDQGRRRLRCRPAPRRRMRSRFERLDYHEVLTRDLQVMDASAISLARENRIPILVFSIFENGGFAEVVQGKGRYTIIEDIS